MRTFKALQRIATRLVPVALALGMLAFAAIPAQAETTPEPWWHLTSGARPTYLHAGAAKNELVVFADNLGDEAVNGAAEPVEITDTLPAHLRAAGVAASVFNAGSTNSLRPLPCVVDSASRVSCRLEGTRLNEEGETVPNILPPYEQIEVRIEVEVEPGAATGEENAVSVSGGQARAASLKRPLTFSAAPTPFGVEDYELVNEEAGGAPDTRAGSHPYQQTTTVELNQGADTALLENDVHEPKVQPAALAKDLSFKWPAGLIGNPTPVARCTLAQFITHVRNENECPAQSAVGVASVTVREPAVIGYATFTVPLFNLEPLIGEPARFGFYIPEADAPVYIDTAVRTGGDYGITVSSNNIVQTAGFLSARVSVWGVPGAPEHARMRGWGCLDESSGTPSQYRPPCEPSVEQHPAAFLTLPTSCPVNGLGQPEGLVSTVEGDSWAQPEPRELEPLGESRLPALDGCNNLPFVPEIKVAPDGHDASSPSGLTVDVHVPQEGQLNATGLAQSNIKGITVTLPDGLTLNPSAADGLEGCSEGQVGYLPGDSKPPSELHFTPHLPGSVDALDAGETAALEPGVNFCPNASKIAEVAITTPLLPKGQTVKGFVYLASPQNFHVFPQENPFETHVAMYIVAEDPISGALVKLPGRVELGGQPGVEGLAPGQIRSRFEDNPQLAFEDAELHFFGGERAPLASPTHCGSYTTNATFTPWSGSAPVSSQSHFEITSGPNGSPCPGSSLPFNASLASGTTNNNAGGFSPLTTTLSRPDGNQSIQSVTLHYPAGLSGLLSGVELCPEAQANAGTCGPNSQIGQTIVSVGVGGDPFTVTGGKAYITGPYEGAPFGLSIVNPAKAGPFNLQEGRPVIVRAKVEVNPTTAALTITTNTPEQGYSIPNIIEGFPLQIQHVNVLVNRPNFTFNPTNCDKTEITGTIDSAKETPTSPELSSPVSDPFQATNCAALKFTPKFTVSTSGKTSKADGASLIAKVSEPNEPQGSQANITKVKVELPKALPSRLTTLQKACTSRQFESNPAACPSASKIGYAVVHTPLLPVPLEGPAIFVSHGGEAFPSLTMVLQGDGVTIDLVGATDIKNGVTSTTFKTVPDSPFSTFELTLPEGPYSALAANADLCEQKLVMPNEFIAQNGAEIHQDTRIEASGCSDTVALVSKGLKGQALTLHVAVPAAGKLKVSGRGLSGGSASSSGRETVTVKLHVKRGGQFTAKVKLSFKPKSGKALGKTVRVYLRVR